MNQRGADRALTRAAAAPVLLCLVINGLLFAAVAVHRPEYLRDYRANGNPDARHYVLLGRNLLLHGDYSRCEGPPFAPDMLRTPAYPVFAGGLDLLGGAGAIYLAQALLQAGSCLLLFALVRPSFGGRAAVCASLLLATDLMLAVSNFEAMSEPLFNFLILAAMTCLAPVLVAPGSGGRRRLVRLAGGGLLVGLATLTRPAGLYLPVVLVGCLLVPGLRRRRLAAAFAGAAILGLSAALLPGLWVARNAVVFSVPRLTTVEAANNVYFMGAGAYQLHYGLSLEDAQASIAREHGLPPYIAVQNPWTSDQSVAEMDAELRAAAVPVLTRYPRELLKSSLLGVAKASVSHNTGELARLVGQEWQAPGTGDLLRLRPEAFARLWGNGPGLALVFGWQVLHALLTLGLAAVGAVVGLRGATRAGAGVVLAVLLYFYLTVAVFGLEAFYRCRAPVLPFLYVLGGFELVSALGLVRHVVRSSPRVAGPVEVEVTP